MVCRCNNICFELSCLWKLLCSTSYDLYDYKIKLISKNSFNPKAQLAFLTNRTQREILFFRGRFFLSGSLIRPQAVSATSPFWSEHQWAAFCKGAKVTPSSLLLFETKVIVASCMIQEFHFKQTGITPRAFLLKSMFVIHQWRFSTFCPTLWDSFYLGDYSSSSKKLVLFVLVFLFLPLIMIYLNTQCSNKVTEFLKLMRTVCLTNSPVPIIDSQTCRIHVKSDINFCRVTKVLRFTLIGLLNMCSMLLWLVKSDN